jgi:hypothetical protein
MRFQKSRALRDVMDDEGPGELLDGILALRAKKAVGKEKWESRSSS